MITSLTPELLAHYQSGSTTLATALRVQRKDGEVFAFTSADHNAEIDGDTYLAGPGLDISAIACQSGTAVDNLELTVFPDDAVLTRPSFLAGLWQGARFELFEYNWADISMGRKVLKRGWLGEAKIQQGAFTIELRSLRQALQQQVGAYSTQTCRNRLGDARCGVDLAPFTYAVATATVTDLYTFTATGAARADDWFGEGIVSFTAGPNAGVSRKVRSYVAGVFKLATPLPFLPEVGDAFTAIAGCRKRHERTLDNPDGISDCRDKFANVLNFNGEPHTPGVDSITSSPDTDTDE